MIEIPPVDDNAFPPIFDVKIPPTFNIKFDVPPEITLLPLDNLPPVQIQNKPDLRGVLIFNVGDEYFFRQTNAEVIRRLEGMNIGCVVAKGGATYVDLRK